MCPLCVSSIALSAVAFATSGVVSGGVAAAVLAKLRTQQSMSKTNNAIIPNDESKGEEHETEYRITQ